jgi:hypothetical protein
MFPKGLITALLLILSPLAIASELKGIQNFNPAEWDTNQIWLDNDATYRQINIGNKLKGANDDTFSCLYGSSERCQVGFAFHRYFPHLTHEMAE